MIKVLKVLNFRRSMTSSETKMIDARKVYIQWLDSDNVLKLA